MQKQIKALEARITELEAFAGVLVPVFEKEYKRQNYNWNESPKPKSKAVPKRTR